MQSPESAKTTTWISVSSFHASLQPPHRFFFHFYQSHKCHKYIVNNGTNTGQNEKLREIYLGSHYGTRKLLKISTRKLIDKDNWQVQVDQTLTGLGDRLII